jgi:alpha-amylase
VSTRVRILAAVAALVLVAAGSVTWYVLRPRAATTPERDVIASLWEWPWTSVATECTRTLGPVGYGAVQVAPPEDSLDVDGHPWWDVYQPVGYDLNSRFGTRDEFAAMVQECHRAGVKVYVDAVINHMSGSGQTTTHGYGSATFTPRNYPGAGYTPIDFHVPVVDCPNGSEIVDWNDVVQVQNCDLLGLADLATESEHVRNQIAGYLNDLLGLGVDGFRVDAAKHIPVADLTAIKAKLHPQPTFWVQEVQPGMPPMSAYEGLGPVLEFNYARNLAGQFRTGISGLEGFARGQVYEPSDKAVVFVSNHDTERDNSTLSYESDLYDLATVFMLAWDYGTPTVFSSFTFSEFDQSPPADAEGFVTPVTCAPADEQHPQWTCEHAKPAIAGMVGFHNATRGQPVTHWWSDGANAIAFARGNVGWVGLNADYTGRPVARTFETGLPAGTYCDLIHGAFADGACTGPTVTVADGGKLTTAVAGWDAVAITTAARLP